MFARQVKAMVIAEMLKRPMAALAYPVKVGEEASTGNGTVKTLGLTCQIICAGILEILVKMVFGVSLTQNKQNLRCAILGSARSAIPVIY